MLDIENDRSDTLGDGASNLAIFMLGNYRFESESGTRLSVKVTGPIETMPPVLLDLTAITGVKVNV